MRERLLERKKRKWNRENKQREGMEIIRENKQRERMEMIRENKQRERMDIGFQKNIEGDKKVLKVFHFHSSSKSINYQRKFKMTLSKMHYQIPSTVTGIKAGAGFAANTGCVVFSGVFLAAFKNPKIPFVSVAAFMLTSAD